MPFEVAILPKNGTLSLLNLNFLEFGPPGGGARPKFYYVDPPLNR